MDEGPPTEIARVQTPRGELVLLARGANHEIVSNGTFLMDTRDGRSERLLLRVTMAAAAATRRVLIGGLGVGFSLRAALDAGAQEVCVLEIEQAVIDWHAGPLARWSAGALSDPRVQVVCADLLDWLASTTALFDVICLDIDNGPQWTVTDGNDRLYGAAGLQSVRRLLSPGGALGVWSAARNDAFARLLGEQIGAVERHDVPVRRGEPDVVYVARQGPRTRTKEA